jgi:CRISPR-associated endonuclease/helicase Cas3
MSRGMTKAERLREMERLYVQHREGLTDAELAERFGVDRTTIFRDRRELECEIPFNEVEPGRWAIDRMKYLSSIRVDLTEALALYLAARRMSRHTRTHQVHVVSALEKLAAALKQPMTEHLVKTAASIAGQDPQPERQTILEILTRGWAEHIKVRITHRALSAKRSMTYVISPYLVEPSLWSDGAYVIGHSDVHDDVATFKIERIERASLTTERFTPPADFDEQELLRFAWGIWTSDEEPVTVRLKFTGREAVTRLKESIWHPSQRIHDSEDGGCIWEAQVAEPQEMIPWVRGWGASVEVLEPEEMREALAREVRRMARVYGVSNEPPLPRYQLLWGKLSRDKTLSHPLICHMLDVAKMAQALWCDALTAGQRAHWAAMLRLDEVDTGRLLAFWAGLHDLGKASPAFQRQWGEAKSLLSAAGLPFPQRFVDEFCSHGRITTATLPDVLAAETDLPERAAKRIARAVGGHHGAWPTPAEEQAVKSDERGSAEWDDVRRDLLCALQDELQPPALTAWPLSCAVDNNAFLTWLSGLVSVADWLGSVEEYFPYIEAPLDPAQYTQRAAAQAQTALQSLHWTDWQPPTDALPFVDLFPFIKSGPGPMQQAVIDLAAQLDQPALVLIEAPTGSGKTEAALYLADTLARTLQQRGIYVAMPTMATSNQMWERVSKFLRRRYPQTELELLLIHSQARWMKPPPEAMLQDETEESVAAALAWFLPRKRSLLAPCAVGTVDQALMCVLQARHFFVRLFGLSEKTVIFDEIHAYDTYMSTLFQRLLDWLRAMGTSVVLLSATLPARTRRELLEAYAGRSVDLPPVEYPAITWTTAQDVGIVPLPKPEDRRVVLEWLSREPEAVVDALRTTLLKGGCAAVICNTVARAQEIYLALKGAHLVPDDALLLFHARYPFGWRDEIERGVLARFGKNGTRPERAIVVATQVIEQSLDLDFDVMVSDLAPVDLIVQRAGRLHRHPGRTRPGPLAAPCLYLAVDADGDTVPNFGRDVYVYTPYLLLRTYLVLHGRDALTLPGDVPALIEAGYGDDPPPGTPPALVAALGAARQRMQQKEDEEEYEARKRLVGKPTFDDLLIETSVGLEEDAPDVHAAFQALTRLGPPTISLVCLHQTPAGLNTEPDSSGVCIDLDRMPDAETTKALARATVGVSRRELVDYFRAQEPPAAWRKHSLLRDHRIAVFTNGVYTFDGHALRLSRELGLQIDPERRSDQGSHR